MCILATASKLELEFYGLQLKFGVKILQGEKNKTPFKAHTLFLEKSPGQIFIALATTVFLISKLLLALLSNPPWPISAAPGPHRSHSSSPDLATVWLVAVTKAVKRLNQAQLGKL